MTYYQVEYYLYVYSKALLYTSTVISLPLGNRELFHTGAPQIAQAPVCTCLL